MTTATLLVLVTNATAAAPGRGGWFYVVASDGARDFQHRVTFRYVSPEQKREAIARAEQLAARVRSAQLDIEHFASSTHWQEAVGCDYTGRVVVRRTWQREVERAMVAAPVGPIALPPRRDTEDDQRDAQEG